MLDCTSLISQACTVKHLTSLITSETLTSKQSSRLSARIVCSLASGLLLRSTSRPLSYVPRIRIRRFVPPKAP
eukprot:scaffold143_cov260-Pinguiococcus_pyrenoidosus.AAC.26